MTRTYSFNSMVTLPRLTSSTALALNTQVLTAASTQEQALQATGGALPTLIVRSRDRLASATQELSTALEPVVITTTPASTKEADSAIDGAWGSLHSFLEGWSRVPVSSNPDPDGIAAIMNAVFPDGLSFLKIDYRSEWAQSQSKLDTLLKSPCIDTLNRLNAQPFVTTLQQAHAAYGAALGLTTVLPEGAAAVVRQKRDAALDALREYVVKVVAWADPLEPGSEDLSETLLAPLEAWVSPESSASSGSSDAESDATDDASTDDSDGDS